MRFVVTMTVGADQDGETLLDWLVYHLVDERRVDVLRALKAGRVAIDRRPVSDPDWRLTAGCDVSYQEGGDDPDTASPWPGASPGRLAISKPGDGRDPIPGSRKPKGR